MIAIINYGLGNLGSIQNMLKKLGHNSIVTNDHSEIKYASKLILPGVGAFDYAMKKLNELGLVEILNQRVNKEHTPILGICLGLQLFSKSSEEGSTNGLGWFDAKTVRFKTEDSKIKIPHMGWAEVELCKPSKLYTDMPNNSRFYFVHSYHLVSKKMDDVLMTSSHGYSFQCALERDNIVGVQFHPEKSHKFGMKLLNNFISYY